MSRDFSKNTANYMSLGAGALNPLLDGAGTISVHAWVLPDSYDTGTNDNRIVSVCIDDAGPLTGLALMVSGSAGSEKVRLAGRSIDSDGLQAVSGATNVGTGSWVSVGGVLDIAGDTIRVYLNGSQDASTAVTFGDVIYNPSVVTATADMIGYEVSSPPAATTGQWDGRIAELAIWVSDIATAGFEALADGYSPLLVKPGDLIAYWPLVGGFSPEIELVSAKNGTITGTVAASAHARVFYPAPPLLGRHADAMAGSIGSGLLQSGLLARRSLVT